MLLLYITKSFEIMSFLAFNYIQPTQELKTKFINQATGLGLDLIIKKSKGQLHCIFSQAKDFENMYFVMIVGANDYILIDLGKKNGFPRGFPIFWVPDVHMQYFGFYPKFGNDERQTPDDLSEFSDIKSVSFFKKWSGFLGQLCAFQYDGKEYWTVTSKNSAGWDSPFVQDAKRLFEPFMTPQVVSELVSQNLHICAEIMSKNDQVHGTRVFNESPVITSIGQGCTFYLDRSRENIIQQNFVTFFDHSNVVDFCVKFGLPCDSAIILNDGGAAKSFITALSLNRDFMNDDEITKLIETHKNTVEFKKGTVVHSDILGNCLEGLVLKLTYTNGNTSIKKYKFPGYTIRTMLFREVFKQFSLNHTLKDLARNFVEHWCVTDNGKNYWYNFALAGFMKYVTFKAPDECVGIHIQLVEALHDFIVNNQISIEFDTMIQKLTNGTIVLLVGPIGSGKTSIMNEICMLDNRLEPIDGDELGIGMELTLKLGKERNDFSRWKVIDAFLRDKIPVFSAGGGIFFSTGKEQTLTIKNQIYDTLKILVKTIVLIPGNVSGIMQLDNSYDPTQIYNDLGAVKKAVINRVKSGQWKLDQKFKTVDLFANQIASKSKNNCEFAKKIIAASDAVFVFPIISSENYGIQTVLDYSELISSIKYPQFKTSGKFGQIRFLTMINGTDSGHITIQYSQKNDIVMSCEQFAELNDFYKSNPIDGKIIVMKSDGGKKISFAMPNIPYHSDGSTHITIDPGVHAPKEMKQAVLLLLSGNQVDLPTKDKKILTYKVEKSTPCKINILGAFGI